MFVVVALNYTPEGIGYNQEMKFLADIEQKLRWMRDDLVIRRLANFRSIRKHIEGEFDAAISFLDDHYLAFDPRDMKIGRSIKEKGGWFRDETIQVFDALNAIGRKTAGQIFLDVGSNIGTQTIYALHFGGFERAICFEPEPRNACLLQINARLNGFSDRIHIITAAAGDSPGRLTLYLSNKNSGAHTLRSVGSNHSISVDVVTVDDTLERLGITADQIGLAWIDVEGFEPEVIAGTSSLLNSKVPFMIEFNPTKYRGNSGKQLLASFAEHYEFAAIGLVKEKIEWWPADEVGSLSIDKQTDLLFA